MRLPFTTLAALATGIAMHPACAADWLQSGYDAAHRGVNPLEHSLGAANVGSLVEIANAEFDQKDSVLGTPVYLSAVSTPSGLRDLLFLTTRNGSLLALDASTLLPIWRKVFPDAGGPIHSSPIVDENRTHVYSYGGDGKVHKYRTGDGEESFTNGWPQVVTLKPQWEHVASALAANGNTSGTRYLYAVTNGYIGDSGDYQGHLTTIDLDSGEQTVFNALCSDIATHFIDSGEAGINDCSSRRAGIWGRPGATFDSVTGRVYVVTGNGHYDANFGGYDWGDSVVALPANGRAIDGVPLDSYTPTSYDMLDLYDEDLGAGSLAIIGAVPGSTAGRLAVVEGKDTILRLIALDDMSGAGGPRNTGGELQATPSAFVCKCSMPQPAVWTADDGSVWVFAIRGHLVAYKIVVDGEGIPQLQEQWSAQGVDPYNSGSPVVANGVVFVTYATAMAFDARNGQPLWQSDYIGTTRRQGPIVVNGRLYVTSEANLRVFAPDLIFENGLEE